MRSWIRNIALVLALLLGFIVWSFTPSKLYVPPDAKLTVPEARPPEGMTIAAIRAGEMHSRAVFAFRGGRWNEDRTFSMGGILVRHPKGTLLFDTGFGSRIDAQVAGLDPVTRRLAQYRRGTPIAKQLKAAGIDPKSLQAVVLTHSHWDHASGLDDLRGVPVWVTRPELDFIHHGGRPTTLIRDLGELNYVPFDFTGGPYFGFEASRDVYGDGSVVLVPAFGHTPGSIIAFIATPDGKRYALIGDLVWQKDGIDLPSERPWPIRMLVDGDASQVRDAIIRMRQAAHAVPSMIVVPAHDARVWQTLPKL